MNDFTDVGKTNPIKPNLLNAQMNVSRWFRSLKEHAMVISSSPACAASSRAPGRQ